MTTRGRFRQRPLRGARFVKGHEVDHFVAHGGPVSACGRSGSVLE